MSKIIDRNGRLFGKVSVIDLLVVLIVAVMAIALNVRSNLKVTNITVADEPITFVCVAENIPLNVADAIRVGDKLYDKENSSGSGPLGEIVSIEVQPAAKTEQFSNGTFAVVGNEDACNLVITVEGSGRINDNGHYSINRVYELGVSAARIFYSAYAQFNVIITDIL